MKFSRIWNYYGDLSFGFAANSLDLNKKLTDILNCQINILDNFSTKNFETMGYLDQKFYCQQMNFDKSTG